MTTVASGVRGLMAAAAGIMAASLLIPTASAVAGPRSPSAVINAASGGARISADTFATGRYTPLTGPSIAESTAGELAAGTTTIMNIPPGFRFNANAGAISIDREACNLRGRLKMSSTQAIFTVTQASTVSGCVLWFVGLEARPTAGPGLFSGNIHKTGTSAAPGESTNYGTLTKVGGALAELLFEGQPSADNRGGTAFSNQPVIFAGDRYGNNAAGRNVRLSITPGTGAPGAHLTCLKNPIVTDHFGNADWTSAACSIDKVGSYKVRATSGTIHVDSSRLTVAVGTASKLVFQAYPSATTERTLDVQPRVAVTDAGGNTVSSYPQTNITLAINKNAGTFTCTGGLTAKTVSGVAHFNGCKQATTGTGYRLMAWAGFANTTGAMFTVTP